MSTLYTHPGITGPHDVPCDAYPAYDGEGHELGLYTIEHARQVYGTAEYDPETHTITVDAEV